MANFKKASVVIASEIINMMANNVLGEVGTEPFVGWLQDGDALEDYIEEGANREELMELMKAVAPHLDQVSWILQQKMEDEMEMERSEISEEDWKRGLARFYYDCVNMWSSSFGLGEDDAIKLGIKDCLSISSWPFSLKIIPIPEPIKRWYHGWLKEHGGYLEPISREGVNRILAKMPFHEYWMRYKALGE